MIPWYKYLQQMQTLSEEIYIFYFLFFPSFFSFQQLASLVHSKQTELVPSRN